MSTERIQLPTAHFIRKTYQILKDQSYHDIIRWLSSGKQFIIVNVQLFEQKVLPAYFRHRNMHSFVRQLNMYGFHKSRKDPTKYIFGNEHFRKGKEGLLALVKRKVKTQEKNDQNYPPVESGDQVVKVEDIKEVKPQHTLLGQQIERGSQNFFKSFIDQKQEPPLVDIPNQSSLNMMMYSSAVLNEQPQVYSKMRQSCFLVSDSESQNVSIEDEIQKQRKVELSLRSGMSLVQTHNLLKTHNHMYEP